MVAFDPVPMGTPPSEAEVTLVNDGGQDLQLGQRSFTGTDAAAFKTSSDDC